MSKPGGGLQAIRDAVNARKSQHFTMAREAGCSRMLLDSFGEGRAELPPEVLQGVVQFIWRYVEYNAALDVLQPVPQPPPRPVGVLPKLEMTLPKFKMGPPERGGPQPEIAAPPKPRRPGWL